MLKDGGEFPYDFLIVAAGSGPNYFGNDRWEKLAPSLKTIESATQIRSRILLAKILKRMHVAVDDL